MSEELEPQKLKESLAELTDEARKEVLAELVKAQRPPNKAAILRESLGTIDPVEAEQILREAAVQAYDAEATRHSSDPDKVKQDVYERFQALPAEAQKDLVRNMVRDQDDLVQEDLLVKMVRSQDSETQRDLAISTFQTLQPDVQRDVGEMLMPEQNIVNRIWMMVVTTFCIILGLSAVGVFYAAITGAEGTQTVLLVFTSTATLLAGLLAGKGLVASVLGRRERSYFG
jgi:hypothetical protein